MTRSTYEEDVDYAMEIISDAGEHGISIRTFNRLTSRLRGSRDDIIALLRESNRIRVDFPFPRTRGMVAKHYYAVKQHDEQPAADDNTPVNDGDVEVVMDHILSAEEYGITSRELARRTPSLQGVRARIIARLIASNKIVVKYTIPRGVRTKCYYATQHCCDQGKTLPPLAPGDSVPLRVLEVRDGCAKMSVTVDNTVTMAIVNALASTLGDAVNYAEMQVQSSLGTNGDPQAFVVTVMRAGGETPHALRIRAEQALETARIQHEIERQAMLNVILHLRASYEETAK
jgi:hypothetical protein